MVTERLMSVGSAKVIDLGDYRARRAAPVVRPSEPPMSTPMVFWVPVMFFPVWVPVEGATAAG
jgi:hypothetical protein